MRKSFSTLPISSHDFCAAFLLIYIHRFTCQENIFEMYTKVHLLYMKTWEVDAGK